MAVTRVNLSEVFHLVVNVFSEHIKEGKYLPRGCWGGFPEHFLDKSGNAFWD